MTDLIQAIAELREMDLDDGDNWTAEELRRTAHPNDLNSIATILNAVASGELIPLAEVRAFTVSDGQRLLQKRDVAGVCDHPDLCFENVGSTARCGPCAAKLAAKAGIELNQYTASNPQAMRLQRELAATQAKLARLATYEAFTTDGWGFSHPEITARVQYARAALEGAKP